jgi:aspartate racemase
MLRPYIFWTRSAHTLRPRPALARILSKKQFNMKTIGLIGGMSWESTIEYYRIVNETVRARAGGFHSAKILMLSVDFAEVERMQHEGRWDDAARFLAAAAQRLEAAGADFILLGTNTMHKVAVEIEQSIHIPFLHIADPTGAAIAAKGLQSIGLLATRFTMEEDFYKQRLADRFQLQVLTPESAEREMVHRVIYQELCLGKVLPGSKAKYLEVILRMMDRGAEGIVLGCTEIGLLVRQADVKVPLFDTTYIHAVAAVDYAMKD